MAVNFVRVILAYWDRGTMSDNNWVRAVLTYDLPDLIPPTHVMKEPAAQIKVKYRRPNERGENSNPKTRQQREKGRSAMVVPTARLMRRSDRCNLVFRLEAFWELMFPNLSRRFL